MSSAHRLVLFAMAAVAASTRLRGTAFAGAGREACVHWQEDDCSHAELEARNVVCQQIDACMLDGAPRLCPFDQDLFQSAEGREAAPLTEGVPTRELRCTSVLWFVNEEQLVDDCSSIETYQTCRSNNNKARGCEWLIAKSDDARTRCGDKAQNGCCRNSAAPAPAAENQAADQQDAVQRRLLRLAATEARRQPVAAPAAGSHDADDNIAPAQEIHDEGRAAVHAEDEFEPCVHADQVDRTDSPFGDCDPEEQFDLTGRYRTAHINSLRRRNPNVIAPGITNPVPRRCAAGANVFYQADGAFREADFNYIVEHVCTTLFWTRAAAGQAQGPDLQAQPAAQVSALAEPQGSALDVFEEAKDDGQGSALANGLEEQKDEAPAPALDRPCRYCGEAAVIPKDNWMAEMDEAYKLPLTLNCKSGDCTGWMHAGCLAKRAQECYSDGNAKALRCELCQAAAAKAALEQALETRADDEAAASWVDALATLRDEPDGSANPAVRQRYQVALGVGKRLVQDQDKYVVAPGQIWLALEDPKKMEQYNEVATNERLAKEGVIRCAREECRIADDGYKSYCDKDGNCHKCEKYTCPSCKEPHDATETCEDYVERQEEEQREQEEDEEFDQLIDDRGTKKIRKCPDNTCKKRIEKNGGCNEMTCKCGLKFCWNCGAIIYRGVQRVPGCGPIRCEVKNVNILYRAGERIQ